MSLFGIFIMIALLALVFGPMISFPVCLVRFLRHRKLARQINPKLAPSPLTPVFHLWLVVGIMALFMIALPNFLGFSARAKSSEAKSYLRAIATAQKEYFAAHGSYAGPDDPFTAIGWEPEGYFLFDYHMGGGQILHDPDRYPPLELGDGDYWPFAIRPAASPSGFTAIAVGNIDNDEYLDVWIVNDAASEPDQAIDDAITNKAINGFCRNPRWAKQPSRLEPLLRYTLFFASLGLPLSPVWAVFAWRDRRRRKKLASERYQSDQISV